MKMCVVRITINKEIKMYQRKGAGSMVTRLLRKFLGLLIIVMISATPVSAQDTTADKTSESEKTSWWPWRIFSKNKKTSVENEQKPSKQGTAAPEPIFQRPTSALPEHSVQDSNIVPAVQVRASHSFGSLMAQTPERFEMVRTNTCVRCASREPYINRGYERSNGDIYLMPYWPFYAQYFQHGDLIQGLFSFETASQAYGGHGKTQDLSKLVFGEQPITIQEILLASKLVDQNKLESNAMVNNGLTMDDHYLKILADQEIHFKASVDHFIGAINYVRAFRNGDVTVGFHIPIKMRSQKLRITNDITPENRAKLKQAEANLAATVLTPQNQPNLYFSTQYENLTEFVEEILSRKGLSFNTKQTILGFSDVTGYVNVHISSRWVDQFLTGFSLQIPTARDRDTAKLWHTDLGNGGFIELSAYASLLWQRGRWLNPYVNIKGTLGLGANVSRRVPKVNTYDGGKIFNGINQLGPNQPIHGLIIFGETLNAINGIPFEQEDSGVRHFADQAIRTKIDPGPKLFFRLGNSIDAVFSCKGFLDLYYDLLMTGDDSAKRPRTDDVYRPDILTHNTAVISHAIGMNYSYQFDAQYRGRLGWSYVFAGRNVARNFGVDLTFNAEF